MENRKIDLLIETLQELKRANERVSELEKKAQIAISSVKEEPVGVLPLMADFTTETFTTKAISVRLGMTPQALNKTLAQKGIIVRYGDKWIVTPTYAPMGLMCVRAVPYIDRSNPKRSKVNLLLEWTKKGKAYIEKTIAK
jgi:hypothetical protein